MTRHHGHRGWRRHLGWAALALAGASNAGDVGTLYLSTIAGPIFRVDYRYDGVNAPVLSEAVEVGAVPRGGGIVLRDDVLYTVGAGQVARFELGSGAVQTTTSGTNANVGTLDPAQPRLWTGWNDSRLTEIPLAPFGPGTVRIPTGSDGFVSSLAFTPVDGVFYGNGGEFGAGNFGRIDLATFVTTRIATSVPATAVKYDPFSDSLILAGQGRAEQRRPGAPGVVQSSRNDSAGGENYLSLEASGRGLLIGTRFGATARLVFIDYSAERLVGAPSTRFFSVAVVGATGLSGQVAIANASGGVSLLESFVGPPGADAGDRLGASVALSDALVVVGAPDAGSGAAPGAGVVYVYDRTAAAKRGGSPMSTALDGAKGGVLLATLRVPGLATGDKFGSAVAVDGAGTRIFVGAPDAGPIDAGQVFEFTRPAGGWSGTVSPSGSPIEGLSTNAVTWGDFGAALALSEDGGRLVVGAPASSVGTGGSVADKWGAATVLAFGAGGVQGVTPVLPPGAPDPDAGFGSAVALGAGLLAVGAPAADVDGQVDAGRATLFSVDASGSVVAPRALAPSDPRPGDKFGAAVAIAGPTIIAVGAPGDDTIAGTDSGSATLLALDGAGTPAPVALLLPEPGDGQAAGSSIASEGGFTAIGAPLAPPTAVDRRGAVYVFESAEARGTTSAVASLRGPVANPGAEFGGAVALNAGRVVVGAPAADVGSDQNEGQAFAFGLDRISRASFE